MAKGRKPANGRYTTGAGGTITIGDVLPPFSRPADHPKHRGTAVNIGKHKIFAGGTRDLQPKDLAPFDILIPLVEASQFPPGLLREVPFGTTILWAALKDFDGVPGNWRDFLVRQVLPPLEGGKKILTFCVGSHGRTGTMLASLIALAEGISFTPDPIAAARKRHCPQAVETLEQAMAVYGMRGLHLPDKYIDEFQPRYSPAPVRPTRKRT
jgi:hypothetical protein